MMSSSNSVPSSVAASSMMNAVTSQVAHMSINNPNNNVVPGTAGNVGTGSTGGQVVTSSVTTALSSSCQSLVTVPTSIPNSNQGPDRILQLISELATHDTRENALMELSRKRESVEDLAVLLWNSFGTIAALLQEIISVYPTIHPPTLNAHQSNRVCNALALLQCVASHSQTRRVFLQANIPLFLYPFLNMTTSSKTRPFEYLRLTSLGVIGALVKTDEKEVINFLLKTEIIPLCLRIMESGTELSKTVATFILQKILLDETGLNYICQTYDRFSHVAMILAKMVLALAKEHSQRLFKHVIRCYLRLSDHPRAREALRSCLPDLLRNNTFANCLANDRPTKSWLVQLLKNVDQQRDQQGQPTGLVPQTNQSATQGPPSNQVSNGAPASVVVGPASSPGAQQSGLILGPAGVPVVAVGPHPPQSVTPNAKSNKM